MADLQRNNPSFVITPGNPWDPSKPFGPFGGPNPHYRGPIQAHELRDPGEGPPPLDPNWPHPHEPDPWGELWQPPGPVTDLVTFFERGEGSRLPGPGADEKRAKFQNKEWVANLRRAMELAGKTLSTEEVESIKKCFMEIWMLLEAIFSPALRKLALEIEVEIVLIATAGTAADSPLGGPADAFLREKRKKRLKELQEKRRELRELRRKLKK